MSAAELRPCIGCDLRPVTGRTYCSTCRERLRRGLPCDLEAYITAAEVEQLRQRERATGRQARPFNRPPAESLAKRLRGPHRAGRRAAGGAA